MTVSGTFMDARQLIRDTSLPQHEAVRLISRVTSASRVEVLGDLIVSDEEVRDFRELELRRVTGEPLQYIEGSAAFGPIEVAVDRRVMIPRPETEQLWERAVALMPTGDCTVVDIGTGSGCIALATKFIHPPARVIATDMSADALAVARQNAATLQLDVEFLDGDLFTALPEELAGSINVLVTNPPYVSADEWPLLPPDVRDHEPRSALVAEEGGVAHYRRLAETAGDWLAPGGVAIMEIGETQASTIVELFQRQGWTVTIDQDHVGRDRFATALPQ